jgi:selenium metabolism protein YedF
MNNMSRQPNTAIMVTKNGMGNGENELEQKLLFNYLTLLNSNDVLPGAICFYTEGVKLATEGSPVLETLISLEKKGVHLILCMTCLKYYNLLEQVRVGIVGGMTDIISAQFKADKVITL